MQTPAGCWTSLSLYLLHVHFSLCCKRTDTSGSTANCTCGTQVSLGAPPACACKWGQINIKDSFLWLQYPCGTFRTLQLSSGPSASPRHTLQSISACGSTACQPSLQAEFSRPFCPVPAPPCMKHLEGESQALLPRVSTGRLLVWVPRGGANPQGDVG